MGCAVQPLSGVLRPGSRRIGIGVRHGTERCWQTAMMTRLAIRCAVVAIVVCALPCQLTAQRDYTRLNVQRGAELSLFAGSTADAPAFGWSAGWRVSPRVALEGSGSWIDEDDGVDGFAAMFGARVYLNTTRRMAPFLIAGAGLFHASVDPSDSRAPAFYLDRTIPGSPEKAFNDFVAAGGAGLDVHVRGRLWLRPDAQLLVVVDGWRSNVLMLAGFHATYRFGGTPGSP